MKKPVIFCLILILCLSLLCSCSKSLDKRWQEQYDLGVRYLSEGNYEEAVIAFTAAIEIDPKKIEAYNGLADAYLVMGDYESAATVWDTTQITDEELQALFDDQSAKYAEIQTGLESGKTGVWITGLSFDKDSFLAGMETKFYVTAIYQTQDNADAKLYIAANTEDSRTWTAQGEDIEVEQGIGIRRIETSLVPVCWEGPYFGIQINLLIANSNNAYDWVDGDIWYITPDGEISYHYAPLNAYGATEFVYRRHYRAFEDFTPAEQQFISSFAAAVLDGDNDTAKSMLGFEFEKRYEHSTIWNGYKIEIYSRDESLTDDGNRSVSAYIELRPENGIGYYYDINFVEAVATVGTESWSDALFIDAITCPCEDWQWNGAFREINSFYHHQTFDNGETVDGVRTYTTTGTIKMGLRSGGFMTELHRVETWSRRPRNNVDTITYTTKTYQDGILITDDGEPVEEEPGTISSIQNYVGVSLEKIYW